MSHSDSASDDICLRPNLFSIGICKILHILFGAFFAVLYLSFAFESSASQGAENQIQITGLHSITNNELLYLLNISPDKSPEASSLRQGIKRAFRKGIFEDIVIERTGKDNSTLRITVKERPVIDSISVAGNEDFSDSFIKDRMKIHEGDRLNYFKIKKSLIAIKASLGERGFPDSEADYKVILKKNNHARLVVSIVQGEPEKIKKIYINGPEEIINRHLKLSPGDIMDRHEMSALERIILNYYKKNDHVNVIFSWKFHDGLLDITLQEGKKLIMVFSGNKEITSSSLVKEANIFALSRFNDEILEETITKIVNLYHKNGYPYVQIAPTINSGKDTILLTFYIFEGNRYSVNAVVFQGTTLAQERLSDILMMGEGDNYNPDLLESDKESILELYHSLGYINSEVKGPDVNISENTITLIYHIKEGVRIVVKDIYLKNNINLTENILMDGVQLKSGAPYNELDISNAGHKIRENCNKYGYLDARVSSDSIIDDSFASITFDISEGEISFFGRNIIEGNAKTRPRVIERQLLHKTGDPLDYSLVLKEKQRLYRTGLFSDIETELLDKINGKRDLLIRLREADAGIVNFGAGYGEYEKQRGFIDISYKNLFGLEKQGAFRTELSALEQRYILSYQEPWFLGKELIFKGLVLHENRKEISIDTREVLYRLKRDSANVGIEKRLGDRLKTELMYEFSVVDTTNVKPDVVLSREDTGSLLISAIRPGIIYDSRDNPFDPKDGILAGLSFKVASALFISESDFLKMTIYANKYQSLNKKTVLALSLKWGTAQGLGDTRELPIVERFFLGGRTTVRGYNQDTLGPKGQDGSPTGGNAFVSGNLELRRSFSKNMGIVLFMDTGNVWHKMDEMNARLKYSSGIGLRYNTPVGPFRIDYAYKLKREKGESKGEIHFSLGQAF